MEIYTNYTFYKEMYKGDMSASDFNKLVIRASCEVQKNIFNRDIAGYEDEVQLATCSVADILLNIENFKKRKEKLVSSSSNDKIITSESVGKLSRTYANASNLSDLEEAISNQKEKITEAIRPYLLHTGLLYRGV